MEGWGERIDYDARNEKADLISKARVLRGGDEVLGSHITYDGRTEFYNVRGGGETRTPNNPDGRVRAVIQPRNNPQAGAGPATQPGSGIALKPSGGIVAPRPEYPEGPRK